MEIKDIIEYINDSPNNANQNVLNSMLTTLIEDQSGGSGSGLGVFKVAQNVTGYDHTSATLNLWYAHDSGMTWQEFVDSEYNPITIFYLDAETADINYSYQFKIEGNAVKMGTNYDLNGGDEQEIVGATPDGVIDDTANYTATFNFAEEGSD